ncbi:unnamed protein product [Amoebophrya sp. A120]|nr:unnamed protein product [Amoebophrya sp. A120]|eukprot:GSA120T00010490001.1
MAETGDRSGRSTKAKMRDVVGMSQVPGVELNHPVSKLPTRGAKTGCKLEDYHPLAVIGKGSYGKVLLVRAKFGPQRTFAMKVLRKDNIMKRNQVIHTQTERKVLDKVCHPFIVHLHFAFQNTRKLYFVLEYCPGGELFFHLQQVGRFSESRTRFYGAEITLALEHLHQMNTIYRDLKPENVLLDSHGHVKITDFGLSKEGVTDNYSAKSMCGTPEYLAPEILTGSGHGKAVDWYSLGALCYEMMTGLPPYYSRDRDELFAAIRRARLTVPTFIKPPARDFLRQLLHPNQQWRLGAGDRDADDVKRHAFFQGLDFQKVYNKRYRAPFVPHVQHQEDVKNFDKEFIAMDMTRSDVQCDDDNEDLIHFNHFSYVEGGLGSSGSQGLGSGEPRSSGRPSGRVSNNSGMHNRTVGGVVAAGEIVSTHNSTSGHHQQQLHSGTSSTLRTSERNSQVRQLTEQQRAQFADFGDYSAGDVVGGSKHNHDRGDHNMGTTSPVVAAAAHHPHPHQNSGNRALGTATHNYHHQRAGQQQQQQPGSSTSSPQAYHSCSSPGGDRSPVSTHAGSDCSDSPGPAVAGTPPGSKGGVGATVLPGGKNNHGQHQHHVMGQQHGQHQQVPYHGQHRGPNQQVAHHPQHHQHHPQHHQHHPQQQEPMMYSPQQQQQQQVSNNLEQQYANVQYAAHQNHYQRGLKEDTRQQLLRGDMMRQNQGAPAGGAPQSTGSNGSGGNKGAPASSALGSYTSGMGSASAAGGVHGKGQQQFAPVASSHNNIPVAHPMYAQPQSSNSSSSPRSRQNVNHSRQQPLAPHHRQELHLADHLGVSTTAPANSMNTPRSHQHQQQQQQPRVSSQQQQMLYPTSSQTSSGGHGQQLGQQQYTHQMQQMYHNSTAPAVHQQNTARMLNSPRNTNAQQMQMQQQQHSIQHQQPTSVASSRSSHGQQSYNYVVPVPQPNSAGSPPSGDMMRGGVGSV